MMKTMIKKILTLSLALLCLLSFLASCDSQSEAPKPEETTPVAPNDPTPDDPTPDDPTPDDPTPDDPTPNNPTPDDPTPDDPIPDEPTPIVLTDFERYQSNTSAPTGHNSAMFSDTPVTETFRAIYKVQEYGTLDYKFFFSNNVNSTYASGTNSYREMPTRSYVIESAYVGTHRSPSASRAMNNKQALLFGGETTRTVEPQETFWSDVLSVDVPNNHFLIFEWTVTYTMIPSTKVSTTMIGLKQEDPATYSFTVTGELPMPDLIGADRGAKVRIGFIGDSITMGEFSGETTSQKAGYEFWAAQIADRLGVDASVWNLGLGYARGDDAANSPSWLYKAKQCDVVGICFGVNDINSGAYQTNYPASKPDLLADIAKIAEELSAAGVEVIIFSTPPYDFSTDEKVEIWREAVAAEKALAEEKGYKFFDFAACLADASAPETPLYGGHPNKTGCTRVADAFMAAELIKIPE